MAVDVLSDIFCCVACCAAFLGQFAEVPKACVFTVEYSLSSAQTAVYGLFETGKEVLSITTPRC
ncbi:MAG: oleate hydratase [Candidatus Reddybacter sp.]